MTPHQGAGAGQAIEVRFALAGRTEAHIPALQDAFVLAEVLGHRHTSRSSIPRALTAYERVRLPMANHVLNGSRQSGNMYEFNGPLGDNLVPLGPLIGSQWDWLWDTTPQSERDRALGMLQSMRASL